MAGNNQEENPTYRQRKQDLEIYSNEIITYAETHGNSVVVAHGVVNRELIKILKKKGWKFEHRDGYGNLSVNCLVK
jgi:broad specificity phosphatase PhoE